MAERMTDDERAIVDFLVAWLEASRAGDTARVLSLMTDDVVFLVPGRAPFGKEAFAAASASMSGVRIDGNSTVEEISVHGDIAYVRTNLRVSMTAPDGKTMIRAGRTLSILRKQADGRWLLARDANLLVPA